MKDHKLERKTIAVIGAGWAGLGCLAVLSESGHHIDVFEENADIGGTWHPSNSYADLGIHDSARQAQYPGFPFPNNVDNTERVTSGQVFDYLRNYARSKGFYDHMTFNTKIESINYDRREKKIALFTTNKKRVSTKQYDYVIYTNGFSNRKHIQFDGADQFGGLILHSLECTADILKALILQNKTIALVGGSKTATDLALFFHKHGYKAPWIYKKPYWFLRFDPIRTYLKKKRDGRIFRNYLFKSAVTVGFMLADWPSLHYWLWRTLNVIHTFGHEHTDFRKFHMGVVDDAQMSILKAYDAEHGIQGEISHLETNGIRLRDNRFVGSDVIICCTGSGVNSLGITLGIDGDSFPVEDVYDVYRSKVIPEIPNLVFTAYHNFAFGTVNGILNGKWIANYIELQASEGYLKENATRFKHPFFLRQFLFDSKEYFFKSFNYRMEPFIKSKEIGRIQYLKWIIDEVLFNPEPARPLEFKMPVQARSRAMSKSSGL